MTDSRSVTIDLEGQQWFITFFPSTNLLQLETEGELHSFHPGLLDDDDASVYYTSPPEDRLRVELASIYDGDEILTEVLDAVILLLVAGYSLYPIYQVHSGVLYAGGSVGIRLPVVDYQTTILTL